MKRRLMCLALAALMTISAAGCRGSEPAASSSAPAAPAASSEAPAESSGSEAPAAPAENFKIGIITGTASQGDEEITQANKMKEKYGDMIVTSTYPDNFDKETETVISNAVAMASDPDVKAIVWCQAIPGTSAAIDKVRETRPDMIFIAGTPGEDPGVIDPKADIVLQVDEPGCGITIPPQAAKQGAKTMIHYSFPRHMSYALIVARHENLKKYCAENGIELVDVTAPDPTGDSGITGAQQFILEDVPRQIEKYGKDTVFFTTNCGMQEPLIRKVFEEGAIYTLQCCPSPFHAFPAALNIDMSGHEADVSYMMEQLQAKTNEAGMQGRVSTWGVPCNMLFISAGVEYAKKVLEGKTNGVVLDDAVLRETIQECANEFTEGMEMTLVNHEENGAAVKNHYLVTADFVNF
ncbi:hypothetical protein C814_00244 [Anaerotruncus sp. G3(2012)]|uniref:DUF3798 domain-containing protein n=1 Tax=Anaerotruncus sp. G3(2012) TaxID=1235835 RepID=UPI000340F672|nr:DUF3798 domain-containing protein [Anaerotruncus sp. G3(2012)]EOS64703.1 hypothetical protein C814_00244 [Anaerotruncus sp. G3(2012)]